MSTYLEICQALAEEVGISQTPSDVTAQTGELKRVVGWVSRAYKELQNSHNGSWRWLRHGFTVNTVADDDTYVYGDCTDTTSASAITRFRSWRIEDTWNPPKIYLTSSGVGTQRYLIFIPWDLFSQIYKIGTQNSGAPAHITVDPQNQLVIGPKPNAVYTITGDYYRSPQILAADADEPEMPVQYHDLIMYNAMRKYGIYESAPEVVSRAEDEARSIMSDLINNQLPEIRLGCPLV